MQGGQLGNDLTHLMINLREEKIKLTCSLMIDKVFETNMMNVIKVEKFDE